MRVKIFDTTLRDGAQTEGISFSLEDKLKIAKLLDELGIHYIEGGWPGSNPKDIEFFRQVKNLPLQNAKICAFSSTRKALTPAAEDKNLQALVAAETPAVAIFGKTWDFHVTHALRTTLEENLAMIAESITYLKDNDKEVFFDAEHFFDGYKANPAYALQCLKTAAQAGADVIVLCDTNGGTLPQNVAEIVHTIKKEIKTPLGIHAHNDSETAVASSILAVQNGVEQVQGTINGYGERCGNANLCSIIPSLKLKMHINCLPDEKLKKLTEIAHHIAEIANVNLSMHQPFVGRSAFAHKAGIHVSAVAKHAATYEHIIPELVGNERQVTISELSGISNLMIKAKEYGISLDKDSPAGKKLVHTLKKLEHEGYSFEEGEASFELLLKRTLGQIKPFIVLEDFVVETCKQGETALAVKAQVKIKVQGATHAAVGNGDGPINALDNALRKVLENIYPVLKSVKLTDYKVRVLDGAAGTAARVRVIVESADETRSWGTVGVSTNVIEASWQALLDALEYKLMHSL